MNLWDGDGLLLLNILHNNQLKELGDTSTNAMVTLPVHVFLHINYQITLKTSLECGHYK